MNIGNTVMIRMFIVLISIVSLNASCFSQKPRADITGNYLLKTQWGGTKPFTMYAPNKSNLGCHSVAFAQALHFHRLSPYGKVSYQCSNSALVSEDFSDYKPRWKEFTLKKDSSKKDQSSICETSRYLYYTASIVRKDFGTNQYVDYPNDAHKKSIESHFHCEVTAYSKEVKTGIRETWTEEIDYYKLIKAEIDLKRPVGFYYTDRKGGGHAVVIDGYVEKNEKVYFHVNFGWFGNSDGWYLLADDLPKNTKEIVVVTIIPKDDKSSRKGD